MRRVRALAIGTALGSVALLWPGTSVAGSDALTMDGPPILEEGTYVDFHEGDGPALRSLMEDEEYEALPPAYQDFVDSHREGDTWLISNVDEQSPAGSEGQTVGVHAANCADDKHCDYHEVRLRVTTGAGYYDTTARTFLTSNRRKPVPDTLSQSIKARHHHDGGDFPLLYDGFQKHCFDNYCQWLKESLTRNAPRRVTWVTLGIIPPSVGIDFNMLNNVFTSSGKGRVTDSFGTDNKFCHFVDIEQPSGNTSEGSCAYGQPLP